MSDPWIPGTRQPEGHVWWDVPDDSAPVPSGTQYEGWGLIVQV